VSTRSSDQGDTSALDRVIPDRAPSVSQVGTLVAFTYQPRTRDDLLAARVVDLTRPLGDPARSTDVAGTPRLEPNTTFRYLGQRQPDVSDDGRFVTFTSDADSAATTPEWGTGPVAGEYATSQVFLWDRLADAGDAAFETPVVLVSQVDGVAAAQGASSPVVSGNGQYVAYTSTSADLARDAALPGGCTIACPAQVYRYDVTTGSSELVSRQNTAEGAGLAAGVPVVCEQMEAIRLQRQAALGCLPGDQVGVSAPERAVAVLVHPKERRQVGLGEAYGAEISRV
jgi:hypothetical protein